MRNDISQLCKLKFFYILIFALLIIGCSKNSDRSLLSTSEELIINNPDSALILLEAIDFPEDMSPKNYAKYCRLLVIAHQKNKISITEDTLIHYAVDYYKSDSDYKEYTHSLLLSGNVYEEQDSLILAEKCYQEVYKLAEEHDFPELLGITSFELGGLYKYINKYEDGIHWFNKARTIFEESNNRKMKHRSMGHIADCYVLSGNTDTALIIYNQVLDNIPPDKVNIKADVYKNISITYKKANLYNESLSFIKKSIETTPTEELYPLQYTILSSIYGDMEILDSCFYYDDLAMQYAKKQKNLSMLYKAYEAMNDEYYPKEFDKYALSRTLSDSIYLKQRYETVKYQRLYNVEKLKKRNKELLVTTQRYLFLAVLIIVISFGLFIFQRNKKKQQQILLWREIEDKNNIINSIKNSLNQRFEIYKRMVRLSISPNRTKHLNFLREYNKILFDKDDDVIIDWNILYNFTDNIFDNYSHRIRNMYSQITEIEEKIIILYKLGFKPTEIAIILDKSIHTIYKYNSTIRKNLGIPEDENIIEFIDKNVI
jgi:tetratricopeptide (TPR) repeat protein